MDFMQALNVTIYGLGIVFLALLILMFSIMVLGKLFEVTTGKEMFSAVPSQAPRAAAAVAPIPSQTVETAALPSGAVEEAAGEVIGQVTAPLPGKILSVTVKQGDVIRKGDEVCVIEAMKMGNSIKAEVDGVVAEVFVSGGDSVTFGAPLASIASVAKAAAPKRPAAIPAPAAPTPVAIAPAPGPSSFRIGTAGEGHDVEVRASGEYAFVVTIDGQTHQVSRSQTGQRRFVVDGKEHSVVVRDSSASGATVEVDGEVRHIDLGVPAAAPAPVAPTFSPGSFKFSLGVIQHQVEVKDASGSSATVVVDGAAYKVERGGANPNAVIVNGKPFVIEIRDREAGVANLLIDGQPKTVQFFESRPAAVAATAMPTAASAAARTEQPPVGTAGPSAPAATAAPVATASAGAGEQVTAPLPGKIMSVSVKAGDTVGKGDELCVIEAMKMGNSIKAQRDGTVQSVLVSPGESVSFGSPLFVIA